MASLHTEGDGSECPEQTNDDRVENSVDAVLDGAREAAGNPVGAEGETEDGKVKSRVVVVDVGNTTHGHERCVVENPTNNRVNTSVVNLVHVLLRELVVATLPANEVVGEKKTESRNRSGTGPVDEGITKKEVLDNVVVPAAHAETNIEKRPLPRSRGKVVLLVRIRDKSVVRSHHGDVQVDEVTKERRFVGASVGSGKLLVPVGLDVPVSVDIARVVLLDTGGLNLLETPLRQVDVASAEVAVEVDVSETEGGSQSADLGVIARRSVVDNLDNPVVLGVADGGVAVARNFVVGLGDGSGDRVRVQVTASLGVDQTNDIAVANILKGSVGIELGLVTVGVEEPVVVGILVVVASDLLLLRALGECLNMRVQKTTTVSHVLECGTRAKSNLERAINSDLSTLKVGLEERAHLSVAGSAVLEDQEMHVEGEHVDDHGDDDQADDAEANVSSELSLLKIMSADQPFRNQNVATYLGHSEVTELVPQVLNCVKTNQSSSEHTDPLDTAHTADRETAERKPEKPLGRERLLLESVETGPAENGGEGEEK